ncbi:NAD(P)-binding protein [Xylariomycetidae sp. FL2044]|nr:NAD(P)-binding protein [Xylariomycetidae sp. FL2044]
MMRRIQGFTPQEASTRQTVSQKDHPARWEGKITIVTGAGCSRIGLGNQRVILILLAEAGASVICADLNLDWAERTAKMVSAEISDGKSASCKADLTSPDGCQRIVNMTCMANMVNIVNMGSVAGLVGGTPYLLYPTSKGAVLNMTRAMAAHHAPDGIRVNCDCPGMLYTPMMYYSSGMSPEVREARRNRSLLRTEGNAWDCATAVRFLTSDEVRWITGTTPTVDAGTTAVSAIQLV